MNLSTGPCFFCRRPMNWFGSDAACLPFCRYCLGYVGEALRWSPPYGALLVDRANQLAERRGESMRIAA